MKPGRRAFLRLLALGASALACRLTPQGATPTSTPAPAPSLTPLQPLAPGPAGTPSPAALAASPTPQPTQAPALFVIDGHVDIAWNALEFGRDPLKSTGEARAEEAGGPLPGLIGERTTGLAEWTAGRVGVIFATVFVLPARRAYGGYNNMTYATPEEAQERANRQVAYYHELAGRSGRFRVIQTRADLDAVVAGWQFDGAKQAQVGLVISMEGADPILSPLDVPAWYDLGVRCIGPAWAATRYAGGTREPGPLTELGRELLAQMAAKNMLLDLSHIAEEAFYQAVDAYPGPLIASHSNPRKFLPTDRGLSDDMLRRLVERDGVIGIALYNRYLKPGWVEGHPREEVTLDTVAQAVDHITQLAGSSRHAAIGSDFDGGFGRSAIPFEMDSTADLLKIAEPLQRWGYAEEDIRNVLNANWLRVLRNMM